jgi:hypothetical protein
VKTVYSLVSEHGVLGKQKCYVWIRMQLVPVKAERARTEKHESHSSVLVEVPCDKPEGRGFESR